ncbi:MAG TPA: Ig-like domain-containing protein [Gemmataceae bacterium]|nr:Ig-like domain-containing protein [Gemmataceae bacterium]
MIRRVTGQGVWFTAVATLATLSLPAPAWADLRVSPPTVILDGPEATQQLLVRISDPKSGQVDLTRRVRYEVANPRIARVDETGLIEPVDEGTTEIRVHHDGQQARVAVAVRGFKNPISVSFEHQIVPLLTKAGCNGLSYPA